MLPSRGACVASLTFPWLPRSVNIDQFPEPTVYSWLLCPFCLQRRTVLLCLQEQGLSGTSRLRARSPLHLPLLYLQVWISFQTIITCWAHWDSVFALWHRFQQTVKMTKAKTTINTLLETEVSKVFIGLIGFKDFKLCAIPVVKLVPVSNGNWLWNVLEILCVSFCIFRERLLWPIKSLFIFVQLCTVLLKGTGVI